MHTDTNLEQAFNGDLKQLKFQWKEKDNQRLFTYLRGI